MKPISQTFDINHFNHLFLYIIFGIIFFKKYLLAFIISILWAYFEILIIRIKPLYNLTKKYWIVPEKYWNETHINKLIDIIINMIGFFIGSLIRLYIID
jgi:hypothetical protein